jgi:monovalent cation:H+ antiporter, CPA1 family
VSRDFHRSTLFRVGPSEMYTRPERLRAFGALPNWRSRVLAARIFTRRTFQAWLRRVDGDRFRMELHIQTGIFLLLIAAVVAMLTRRLRLPYSVGLVVAGIVLAFVPLPFTVALSKNLVFTVLLPPLLFEAAFHLDWSQLKRDFSVLALLVTLGVLVSASVTAVGMHFLMGWEWTGALLFGSLIAATDPVSVIATFKEAKIHGRLLLLVEAESLLNDGTAATTFAVLVALASGEQISTIRATQMLLIAVGGGVLCGATTALLALLLMGRTTDHLVEITFTTVAAYASFLLADHLGMSGVLSTITAGLVMSNFKAINAISPRGRESIETAWEYAAFVANSIVFLLIGMHEAHQNLRMIWGSALIAIGLVLFSRALAVFPCCAIFFCSRLRVSGKHQFVLFWGGLRGALALALALGLPAELALREQIISVTFAVVAFSIFVQGLTMTPLLYKLGEIPLGRLRADAEHFHS